MLRSSFASILALASLSLVAACSDDSPSGGGGAGGAPSGGAAEGGGGSDASCSVDAPCGDNFFGDICLYSAEEACSPGAIGTCNPSNGTCDGPPTGPVCDCDGVVHEGDFAACDLGADGVPFGPPDACATGMFSCGDVECVTHIEICVETSGGPQGAGTTYECAAVEGPLQGQCSGGIADCACLDLTGIAGCGPGAGGGCSCASDAYHQETVTVGLP